MPILTKICFYWSISISEINIKCKSISRHSKGGAPSHCPTPRTLEGATCPVPYARPMCLLCVCCPSVTISSHHYLCLLSFLIFGIYFHFNSYRSRCSTSRVSRCRRVHESVKLYESHSLTFAIVSE